MTMRDYRYRFGAEEWADVDIPLYAHMSDGFGAVILRHALLSPAIEPGDTSAWERFYIENDIASLEAQAAAKLDKLTVDGAFKMDLVLKTGPLNKPLIALNECVDELMTHWGIDVGAHKTLSRRATPVDMAAAASMVGYPPKMLRQNLPGLVNVRLDISETGRVTACHIQMPMSDPEFEESSCADIQHAFEFEPALDKEGKPIKSYYVTVVRFTIGGPFYRSF